MSDSFVDNTLTIMTRAIIPFPEVRAALELVEDQFFPGPLSHTSKMLGCVQKAGTPQLIRWAFLSVIDACRTGDIPLEGISERALKGHKGTPGLVEVFNFKYECKQFMLGSWLEHMLQMASNERPSKISSHLARRIVPT